MISTRRLLVVLVVFGILGSGVAMAASYGLNASAENHPDTYFKEDQLTVESHDRSTMDWLQYENDNGEIATIDAFVNGTSQDARVKYRADQIEDDSFLQFPRTSSESNNSNSWALPGNWTAGGANSSKISVTDSDGHTATGVESLNISTDGTMASGDTAYTEFTDASLTSDVQKRYLQLVLSISKLETGAVAEVQVRDSDGDYVAAEINGSASASAEDVIANATGNGIIYQVQLGQLTVQGSGDGTMGAIETVRIVTKDGDVTAYVTALNVQKKSRWDFGEERVPDTSTDDSGDYKDETVYQRPGGGLIDAHGLGGLGDTFSDATVHKLRYQDVHYRMQDKSTAVSIEFADAGNYPGFDAVLDVSWRRTLPTGYDVTHGSIDLVHEQTFLSERYVQLRHAEGVGDTETSEIADSSWIDSSSALGDEGKTVTMDDTVTSGTTYVAQFEVKLIQTQVDTLKPSAGGAGGFWQAGGNNPLASIWNWLAGGLVGLLSLVGIKMRGG